MKNEKIIEVEVVSKENEIVEVEKITITVKQAAKMLGISEKSAYKNLITLPGFPVVKIGKRLTILRESFLRWLEENKGVAS
jgi:hypothetical protein